MALKSLLSMFSNDLAIDLGTANTLVYAKNKGIVVREPSIVAVNKINNNVEAVGKEAKEMLGRTPGNIVAIRPMRDGVIADFEVTEKMIKYFIEKAHGRRFLVKPRIVISVPSEITQVEKRAVKDSALRAGQGRLSDQRLWRRRWGRTSDHRTDGNMIADNGGGPRTSPSSAGGHRLLALGARGRQRDGRRDHSVYQTQYNLLIGERPPTDQDGDRPAFPLDEEMTMESRAAILSKASQDARRQR
jgi:rod shape-determining protein MreB